MATENIDTQLRIFQRQYLQLLDPDFLTWPAKALLRNVSSQEWLYRNLFLEQQGRYLPPVRYQFRVLKSLLAKIEQAIDDPDQDEISDSLMSHFSELLTSNLPTELTAVQQRAYVTFSCVSAQGASAERAESSITLLERRNLISGSKTTGFRTWEAALHLATFLLTDHQDRIRGKSIIELGAGTGFLSILCAKVLGARHVTTTDGDEGVIDALKENLFLNGLDDQRSVQASVLRWGHSLRHNWVQDDCEEWPYDIVIGADIIYDKTAVSALVATLDMLFEMRPKVEVIVASAVRNADTFEAFRFACGRRKFSVEEISFAARPMRDQPNVFYATAVPLKILAITAPTE
ncbi:hypothetical protein AMS68_005874 [Peltaster fructicola]|uniref:FAM86 N-terminal domain-containing protein n=1 Tax=Peltaster fructicola TaxID=286661 RepID=A0A6H0Y023_9PEZI|nr:hypothetical protein AMS68_005874 [Peltaster fructicola]